MSSTTWKDREGVADVGLTVRVRSTGRHEDARAGEEEEREESREIVEVEVGGVTLSARYEPALFLALAPILQEDVDGMSEQDFDWEADE